MSVTISITQVCILCNGSYTIGSGSAVIYSLFVVACNTTKNFNHVCGNFVFGPCFVMQHFLVLQSSPWGRERAGCLTFNVFWMSCSCIVICLFLTVQWVGLWCVIVAFSGHTHWVRIGPLVFDNFPIFSKKNWHTKSQGHQPNKLLVLEIFKGFLQYIGLVAILLI